MYAPCLICKQTIVRFLEEDTCADERDWYFVRCDVCNIVYFGMSQNLWHKNKVVATGPFEYCCKIFKMKAFL